MPLYNIASRQALPDATRKTTAAAVTDIHCQLTGAPAEFVNVIFMDGHPIRDGHEVGVVCNVRKGGNRDAALIETLRQRIQAGVAEAIGVPPDKVLTSQLGFPASWVMEGGEILPEPGEEADWLDRQASK